LTTIVIFKQAKIESINKNRKSMTASGIDTVTGRLQKRTFNFISDKVLEKAEFHLEKRESSLIIEVDSGTRNIDLRADQNNNRKQREVISDSNSFYQI
jgi:hypothetical protein